jgi:hypothetical protein
MVCTEPTPETLLDTCFVWDDKVVGLTSGDVAIVVSGEASEQPLPVYRRGLWFDGGDSLVADGLVLNTAFTLELWVLVSTPGQLLTITPTLAAFAVDASTAALSLLEHTSPAHTSETIVPTTNWHNVAFVVDGTALEFYIDGVLDTKQ